MRKKSYLILKIEHLNCYFSPQSYCILFTVALNTINQTLFAKISDKMDWTQMKRELKGVRVRVIVVNATFNNISIVSWRSVILVEETGPGENH
jgi:hypothetical protein